MKTISAALLFIISFSAFGQTDSIVYIESDFSFFEEFNCSDSCMISIRWAIDRDFQFEEDSISFITKLHLCKLEAGDTIKISYWDFQFTDHSWHFYDDRSRYIYRILQDRYPNKVIRMRCYYQFFDWPGKIEKFPFSETFRSVLIK